MEWGFLTALVLAIPVILFPVALVWYFNAGSILAAIKKIRARRACKKAGSNTGTEK
jgi:hypothetical protein